MTRREGAPFRPASGSRAFGQPVDQACPAQQFQVIETLVPRDLARFRHGDRVCQQCAAAVAVVADARRNPGQPSDYAASKAFCSNIAASNRGRQFTAIRQSGFPPYKITSSAKSSRAYRSATQGFAKMAMWADGNRPRIARSAGSDITASPTQFVARTRMREKFTRSCYSIAIVAVSEGLSRAASTFPLACDRHQYPQNRCTITDRYYRKISRMPQ